MGGVRKAPNRPHRRSHEQGKHDQGGHCGGRAGNGRRGRRHRRRGRGSEWNKRHDGYDNDPVNAVDDHHSVHDNHPVDAVKSEPDAELDESLGSPLPEYGQRVERGIELEIRIGQRIGFELHRPTPGAGADR
jgi:hypothetical protein